MWTCLILLCHNLICLGFDLGWLVVRQQGHRGSRLVRVWIMRRRIEAIDVGLWRSGRTGSAARLIIFGYCRCFEALPTEPRVRGEKASLGDEEAIGRDAERGVVVKAPPAAALVVAEPEFLLEFLIVTLDPPAPLGRGDEILERRVGGQRREPILARLVLARRALDHQPLWRPRRLTPGIAVRRSHAQGGEAGGQCGLAALTPCHRPERRLGQRQGEILGRDRPLVGIPAQACGWPSLATRRQRFEARRPHRGRGQDGLALALREIGRIERTLFTLDWL